MNVYIWTYEVPDYCSIDDIIRLNVLVVALSEEDAWTKVRSFAERKCYPGCYNTDGELNLIWSGNEISSVI